MALYHFNFTFWPYIILMKTETLKHEKLNEKLNKKLNENWNICCEIR